MKHAARALALAVVFTPLSGRAAAPGPVPDPFLFREFDGAKTTLSVPLQGAAPGEPDDIAYRLVLEKLQGALPPAVVRAAFADPRVRLHSDIPGLFDKPAETRSYARYRPLFITRPRIDAGRDFHERHRALMAEVERRTGVDALVVLAIVGVETFYGRHHGFHTVFNALYTQIHTIPRRRGWAANELAHYLKLTHREGIDPHSLRGSYAGAFGHFQFIPSSFNSYAVDFDGDGRTRPDEWPDVLGSIANYLKRNGYRAGETDFGPKGSAWRSIYAYNHSENYVTAVLELRAEIKSALAAAAAISRPRPGS